MSNRSRRRLAILLFAAFGFADDRPSFSLAVLRRDGILIPFASHHHGRWSSRWPVPGRAVDLPIGLDDVPDDWWGKTPPTTIWTLWPTSGAPRPVRATAPTRYPAQCIPGFGFRTDYKAALPLPPPMERPFPKDGLAVSGAIQIERIEVLDAKAPEWEDFARRMSKPFDAAERDAIRAFSKWTHPAPAHDRARQPVTVEALYRSKIPDAGEIYYIEASRSYDDPRQADGCDAVTFAAGWVRPWKPEDDVFDVSAVVTYCDRADAEFVLPLGLIRFPKRPPVWILQVAGWDYERYVVVETGRRGNRLLIGAFGGSCPRPPRP